MYPRVVHPGRTCSIATMFIYDSISISIKYFCIESKHVCIKENDSGDTYLYYLRYVINTSKKGR